MTLILIILALLINHISVWFDGFRQWNWFHNYLLWQEQQLSGYGIWKSAVGVLIPVLPPLLLIVFIQYLFNEIWFVLGIVFSLLVLIICLDREQLIDDLEDCLDGCRENDVKGMERAASRFTDDYAGDHQGQAALFRGIFLQHQSKVLGVLFWFVLLGVLGAVLYRLSHYIYDRRSDIHGGFEDSVRNLHFILNWPVTRLSIVSYALVGSLMDTIETWQQHDSDSHDADNELLGASGLAAIQYQESDSITLADWLMEIQGLMNRALVLWLIVIALVTISGWLA